MYDKRRRFARTHKGCCHVDLIRNRSTTGLPDMDTTPHDHAPGARAFAAHETPVRAIVIGILSLAAAAQAVQFVVAARSSRAATGVSRPRGYQDPVTANHSTDPQVSALIGAHLFGVSTQSVIQTSVLGASLQWTLSGTLVGSSPSTGSAIVSEQGKIPLLRAVGDEISSRFKLVEVRAESVVLDRDGQRVTVNFSKSRSLQDEAIVTSNGHKEVFAATATPAVWHPRKGWPQNRPPALVVLRPQVHLGSSGHYNGMQVMGGGSALANLGLQRGDVITQVNGKTLRQPADAQLALVQMSTSTPVTVTVERGGTTQQIAIAVPDDHE
jgi:type II secretory pathway component PulC